ncbi:MAG TPA: hypothetical protein VF218_11615 [Acidothermaceae bacterium]|jgi:hypothetical protein
MPIAIVLGVLFAIAGWQEARRFEKQYGRTPWGWDPIFWGVILFLVWPIGLLLLAIGERAGRKQAAQRAATPQPWAPATGFTPPPFGDVTFPSAQQPYAAPATQQYGQPPTAR